MRRIVVAIALVALLAAAIAIPAVAQTGGVLSNIVPLSALSDIIPASVLSSLGFSPTDDSNINDDANISNTSDPSVSSSNTGDQSVSSSDSANDPAAVSQEFSERRITSGKASPSFSVSNSGDNANICATGQQVVNTGNVANQQGVVQYNSTADDIDLSGSSISIDSSATGTCTQTIDQAAAGK
jgi:hypothetical protein